MHIFRFLTVPFDVVSPFVIPAGMKCQHINIKATLIKSSTANTKFNSYSAHEQRG